MYRSDEIHEACEKGDIDTVKLLLAMKCEIEEPGFNGQRPIHFACANGHVEIVKLLIEEGCKINEPDRISQQPIHVACDKGHVEIVKLLIEANCGIEDCGFNGQRLIHIACANGHANIVKLLIENNCNIEACVESDWRPIHFACRNGHVNIVKLLIESKCDIEAQNKNGHRPIHFACDNGHVDIVKLLIEYKCDIEACDKAKQRPINFACNNGNIHIVKLLIDKKCNIGARDQNGHLPIHLTCNKGYVDIVKLLIRNSDFIEACDKNNWRPIHFASRFGSVPIVKLLIAYNCDINATTRDKKFPMSIAKECKHEKLINVLIYERWKKKMVRKIKKASEVKCGDGCNHKSCPRSLDPIESKSVVIGRGQYGKVYKSTEHKTKMEYAVKSIKTYKEGVKRVVHNFEDDINEYRSIIKHPRIIEYFGSFSYSMRICIFMECFPKGSLHEEIEKSGSLPHDRIARYTKQILEGVAFLHNKKIIHRDIKPHNILLDDEDNTKLCDFGLSRFLVPDSIRSKTSTNNDKQNKDVQGNSFCGIANYMAPETITGKGYSLSVGIWSIGASIVHVFTVNDNENKNVQANTFCGTANYMAPEVIHSYTGAGYSFPADIWSVGATIVHMLTGRPPYSDFPEVFPILQVGMGKKIEFEPREPMSDNMKLFVKEALNPDPSKRATAEELWYFLIAHDVTGNSDSTDSPQELG